MSRQAPSADRAVRGTIRRRLLVNAVVDPDEAARRLPQGVRPHVTAGGTVVGCCLLEIESLRPAGLPAFVGQRLRAAAHRISVEWDDGAGETVTGVYVPVRHTDSRPALALGGRWFPGVHERAHIEVLASEFDLWWRVDPFEAVGLGIRVAVSVSPDAVASAMCDQVGATCLGASIGVSPGRRGLLEAARMEPAHRDAQAVTIESLESGFLDGFSSARLSLSYLMCDANVTWTRAAAPAIVSEGVPA
jgi:hypothetical protein